MKLSLQAKILLYIILPLVVLFLSLILLTENLVKKEELATVDSMMSIYTADLAEKINIKLHDVEMVAVSGADFVEMSEFVNDEQAYAFLSTNKKKSDLILGSRFAFNEDYNNGKVRINSISTVDGALVRSELSGLINISENWYQVPATTGKAYWEEPFIDRETKIMCSRVSVPIKKNGKTIGVSSAIIDLTKFKRLFDTTLFNSINFIIVSGKGQFIYHYNTDKILKANILTDKTASVHPGDLQNAGSNMLKGESGKAVLRLNDEPGENLLAYYRPVTIAGWSCSVSVRESEILANSRARRQTSMIIAAIALLVFLLIARQLSKRISRSLEETMNKLSFLNSRLTSQNVAINAAAIVSVTDVKGNIIEVNDEFCRVSKYRREELIGKNHRILNSGFHPGDFFKEMWTTIANGHVWRGQVRNKARDGSFYWVDSVIAPIIGDKGKPIEYLSIRFDITETKEIERKIAHINKLSDNALELTVSGAWEIDLLDQEWYTSSERAAKIFGDPPAEGHRYKLFGHWAECVKAGDPDYAARTFEIFTAAVEGRIPRYDAVYAYKRPVDGKIAWIHAIGEVERDASGKAVKMVGVAQDITEMRRAEQELLVAKSEAEQANSAKSEFLARMSHEIRTPMNAIIGLTYLTLKTGLSEKQRDSLNKVHASGLALLSIINDILDFSKIESGKLEIEHSEFNLEKVFNDLSNIVTYKAHEKGLEFVIGLSPGIPSTLVGDSLRLNQILINLANNAIKFTATGEIIIKAEIAEKQDDRVKILFSVKDTGIGLTETQIGNLFKSFSQADASTTRKYGGTGLGLAISKSLTELMGGEIWVEGKEGKGSRFSFTTWFGLGKEKKSSQLLPSIDLRGMKVLVCDDNETSCEILREALESFSFKVVTVTSGLEAIREIEKNSEEPFELVLMDWNMPELNGLETVRLIKKDKKIATLPIVIMVTAYNSFEVATEAEKIGIANTLVKPVSYSTLFNTIMQSFGKKVTRKQAAIETSVPGKLISGFKGARVLLVEDNEINQDVAIGMLEAVGIKADIANNGKEAVEMVIASGKPSAYELIIMDLQMPEMDGYEASRRIKKLPDYKDIPIFAMTADAVTGVKENCFKAGMIDFVSKPIVPERLYTVLTKWITRKGNAEGGEADPASAPEQQTKKSIAAIEGLNVEEGLNRMNNNTELYMKLLEKFAGNYSGYASELKNTLERGISEESKRLVHTLKGVSGNIGAIDLHDFLVGFETRLKSKETQNLGTELETLENLLFKLIKSIKQALEAEQTNTPIPADSIENVPDATSLKTLLRELTPLLQNNDTEAVLKAKKLAELTRKSKFSEETKKINEYTASYDFDEAKKLVDELTNRI